MPLPILLTMVVGGIAGIAFLLHSLGHSRRFDLANAGVARAEWARHWPDDEVSHVYMSNDAALVETDRGPGLLRAFGADTVAHRITIMDQSSRGLRIGFGAFDAPDAILRLSAENATLWLRVWQEAKHG